jgi:rubrerythrin
VGPLQIPNKSGSQEGGSAADDEGEMTYHRYKNALVDIAAGAPDPVAVAKEALRVLDRTERDRMRAERKRTEEIRAKQIRERAKKRHDDMIAKNLRLLWLTADKRPAEIARELGVSRANVATRINAGLRHMQRVMWWRCEECGSNENIEYRYSEYADADKGCIRLCPLCFDKHPDYHAGGWARP